MDDGAKDKEIDDNDELGFIQERWHRHIWYIVGKERGKGFASLEVCIDASIQRFDDYIEKNKEKLISAISNSYSNIRTNRKTTKTRKQKWEEKTTVWIFQATNWWNCLRKDLDNDNRKETSGGLVWFYGISIIVGYLMPNLVYTQILDKWFVNISQ